MLCSRQRVAAFVSCLVLSFGIVCLAPAQENSKSVGKDKAPPHEHVSFSIRSVKDGNWSDAGTWKPARVPGANDRVLVSRDTKVLYDVKSDAVIRLVQVFGNLTFTREKDTELNVGVLKAQNSEECSESGFACDFEGANFAGEPQRMPEGKMPTLEIGTLEKPIPSGVTARIRLHLLEGMDPNDSPAIVCCSARMEIHGSPLKRTWVKLAADVKKGDSTVVVGEEVADWKVGDEVIVTGSLHSDDQKGTEERKITKIDGTTLTLDKPLDKVHFGSGEFKSEVANLSRNVIVESANPDGVRGHTMYHAFSQGGISYARFAHLGKKNVLGRYAIHFHLIGDSMRGSQVLGVAVVDSHNRWVTIHGTQYLIVKDCIGYKSVGHGFFMEDGTEIYNLLDRNLGVQALRGKTLPKQVLPFDPNEGGAFWWANGRNSLVRNVACENEEYGYRYDMQDSKYFSSHLPMKMPNGKIETVDIRTIPIWRFEDNESHTEGLYGLVVAANGNNQPDAPINDDGMLNAIKKIDWTGPDTKHPHMIKNFAIWEGHYAIRPHSPSMLMENIRIHHVAYGIYRPAYDNHVYKNLHLSNAGGEPFNRGMDDASAQFGIITVDGFKVEDYYDGAGDPIVHMTDNNLSGPNKAAVHFRNLSYDTTKKRRAIFDKGGGAQAKPFVKDGVPYYIHDHYGPGRDAKIVLTSATDLTSDGAKYEKSAPLTGHESVMAEVADVPWPELLQPVDDVPPATIITSVRKDGNDVVVRGTSHDNGEITKIDVSGTSAKVVGSGSGVVEWEAKLRLPENKVLIAVGTDAAGNVEQTGHRLVVE